MMSFDELCGSALGAADYTAISEAFHTVFVHGVPMMSLVHLNQVRLDEADRASRGTPLPLDAGLFSLVSTITHCCLNQIVPVEATIDRTDAGRIPFSRPIAVFSESVNRTSLYVRTQAPCFVGNHFNL